MDGDDRGGKRLRVGGDFDLDALRGAGVRGATVVPMTIDEFEAAQAAARAAAEAKRQAEVARRAKVSAEIEAAKKKAKEAAAQAKKAERDRIKVARAKLAAEIKACDAPVRSAFAEVGYGAVPPDDAFVMLREELDMLGLEVGPLPYADGTLVASKSQGFRQLFAIVGSEVVQVANKQLRAVPVPAGWAADDGKYHTLVVRDVLSIVMNLTERGCAAYTLLGMDDLVVMRRSPSHADRAHAALRGDLVGDRAAYWKDLCAAVIERHGGLKYASVAKWIDAAKSLQDRWGPDVEPLPHLRAGTVLADHHEHSAGWYVQKYTFGRHALDMEKTRDVGVISRYASHGQELPPAKKTPFGTLRAPKGVASGTHRLTSALYILFDDD